MNQMVEKADHVSVLAQAEFDAKYITSSELCERLKVSRFSIHNRRQQDKLPGSIKVYGQQLVMWERAFIEPHVQQWERELKLRRGVATQ